MKAIQNIHQLNNTAQRAIQLVSNSLCEDFSWDVLVGFTYNNEPKQDTDLG
jgi:Na+/H+ antiporter NhaB